VRARWPEVLAAVQQAKKVAWMQLSNASVESYADGVLTLAFAQAGIAQGFVRGGYEQDLARVLTGMFGTAPRIATTIRGSGGATPTGGTGLSGPAGPAPAPPPGAQDGPGQRRASAGGRRAPAPASEDPDPGDEPAPDVVTGADLIERELGGRLIEETGGS
jgi:hypothetical protein